MSPLSEGRRHPPLLRSAELLREIGLSQLALRLRPFEARSGDAPHAPGAAAVPKEVWILPLAERAGDEAPVAGARWK